MTSGRLFCYHRLTIHRVLPDGLAFQFDGSIDEQILDSLVPTGQSDGNVVAEAEVFAVVGGGDVVVVATVARVTVVDVAPVDVVVVEFEGDVGVDVGVGADADVEVDVGVVVIAVSMSEEATHSRLLIPPQWDHRVSTVHRLVRSSSNYYQG